MPEWVYIIILSVLMFILGMQQSYNQGWDKEIEFRNGEIEFVEKVEDVS